MGKIILKLALDSPDVKYVAGSTVSGHVFFELKKPLKIRGVRVYLKGEELVEFKERIKVNRSVQKYKKAIQERHGKQVS